LERYFGAFLDEILSHDGDINELAGDGLMIVFQDPDPRRHARSAVRAALGILRRTREINLELRDRFDPIALHAGVNSGRATLGVMRIEGQAGTRWTYTACGRTTNLAARLAELSDGDAVIVGPGTRQRLAAEFSFEELGEVRLRSMERPVSIARLPLRAEAEPTPTAGGPRP
jgi:class 3 adenylate cyclase